MPYQFYVLLFRWVDRLCSEWTEGPAFEFSSLQEGFRMSWPLPLDAEALVSLVTKFRPSKNWSFWLNYTLKQAKSKNIKPVEKYPYHPIAKFGFGHSTIGFSLAWSQAETEPCFCWLKGRLTGGCFGMPDQLPRHCLREASHGADLTYIPALCLHVKPPTKFLRFLCSS